MSTETETCLALISQGRDELQRNITAAEQLFGLAGLIAKSVPSPESRDLILLTVYNLSLVRRRQGNTRRGAATRADLEISGLAYVQHGSGSLPEADGCYSG